MIKNIIFLFLSKCNLFVRYIHYKKYQKIIVFNQKLLKAFLEYKMIKKAKITVSEFLSNIQIMFWDYK